MQNLLTATAPVRLTRTLESKAGLNAGLNHRQENGLGFQSIFEATPPSWSGKMAATRDNPNLQYMTVQTLTLKANALKQSSNCCENTCKAESYVPTVKFVNLRVRKHCIFSSLSWLYPAHMCHLCHFMWLYCSVAHFYNHTTWKEQPETIQPSGCYINLWNGLKQWQRPCFQGQQDSV